MDLKKDRTFETDKTLLPFWSKAQLTSADFIPQDGDSIERITTIGVHLTNPYLVPNMQQAYTNLGLSSSMATITNKYVRFKPTVAQLATLDSIMDAQGLELFDTPVDYVVTYEGDYYQDPSIPDSLPTWQYAVVPTNFVFPSGITYEILAQIHIPGNSYTAVETEAERLASIQDSLNGTSSPAVSATISPNFATDCPVCYIWDPIARQCVPQSGCGANPPPPAADAAIPAGNIFVFDTNLPSGGSEFPVRKLRVVARRWFKEERVFTDNNGHFVFTKRFKNKVRIIEKFKNADAYVYGLRGGRLWQMLFPVKRTLGIYSSTKATVSFPNSQSGPVNSKANRYWVAATVHNAVQEHNDYAIQFHFSQMPATMHIFITSWATYAGSSSTPLFRERRLFGFLPPVYFVSTFMLNPIKQYVVGGVVAVANIASIIGVDMVIDYVPTNGQFVSDAIKEIAYHEMSHASHYSQAGNTFYGNFVTKLFNQVQLHSGNNDPLNPYGSAGSSDAPFIDLPEAWGYHMGHFLADQRYGVNATCTYEGQQFQYCPSPSAPLVAHPHIDVLENFVPTYTTDPFYWIPKGLMEDLIDNAELVSFTHVNDNVSGITITQIFAALQSDVTTLAQYKARLLQQIGANQTTTTNINNLFASYGY